MAPVRRDKALRVRSLDLRESTRTHFGGIGIKRLQTYFALMATLLTLMAGTLIVLISCWLFDTSWYAFLLLLPISILVFSLSLVIGHFLAEPMNLLVKKVQAYRAGADVSFEGDGRLLEADELAATMDSLVRKVNSQRADLVREERRQSEFVSDVAHELRTPLTAIRGNAEMLADPDLPPSMREKFTGIIISEAERLSRLVNDLLTLQRIENDATPTQLERVDLRTIASNVVDTLQPILIERQANVEITGEAPDVLGNPDRLKEALTNLVENASRFIEPDGHITIELCGLHGNSVIQVKDDGCGFGDIDPNL